MNKLQKAGLVGLLGLSMACSSAPVSTRTEKQEEISGHVRSIRESGLYGLEGEIIVATFHDGRCATISTLYDNPTTTVKYDETKNVLKKALSNYSVSITATHKDKTSGCYVIGTIKKSDLTQ